MQFDSLEFLLASQHETGGWGYAPEQNPIVEPTAAVMLAIGGKPAGTKAYQQALSWLLRGQNADGGWGIGHEDSESTWQTAWAVLALAGTSREDDVSERGIAWLSGVDTAWSSGEQDDQLDSVFLAADPAEFSWPWLPGEATWIEPSALAILALGTSGLSSAASVRMNDAVRFFLERRCVGGGWNVGNPVMFDTPLPARACQTAWALMALQQIAPDAIQDDDIQMLQTVMYQDSGVLALAWGLLALRTLGVDDDRALASLVEFQMPDGSWNHNPYHTAVVLMAQRGGVINA